MEALRAERGGELSPEYLDGDDTIVSDVARQINGRHPAGPNLVLDHVTVRERGLQETRLIGIQAQGLP